jgi:hypothetical protein
MAHSTRNARAGGMPADRTILERIEKSPVNGAVRINQSSTFDASSDGEIQSIEILMLLPMVLFCRFCRR